MENYYTDERNVQIVIALLKAYNIKKIIVSPGATNISFVGSIQNDNFFEVYSCVDERSAAYMACGMAAESGEPVVINCTGATSSRNWLPGLTEAFYRKLPILALSSSQDSCKIGHLVAQVTDRRTPPIDSVVRSYEVGLVNSDNDEFDATVKVNSAIHLLFRNGGGPVHINLITAYSRNYTVRMIPPVRKITYYNNFDYAPEISEGKIAIAIGTHTVWSKHLVDLIDRFCEVHNAVVFCDHTSGYSGKYKVNLSISFSQVNYYSTLRNINLLIHIGEVSGDYYNLYLLKPLKVWRVSPDGEIRDLYHKLDSVFDMTEEDFFSHYSMGETKPTTYMEECENEYNTYISKLTELPFSNLWVANKIKDMFPANSVLHLGILNSLRSWNYFKLPPTVQCSSNTGGFGIDGIMSSLIGASLCNSDKLYYCILGDLSFFYDLNSIGNRHIRNNVRILLINNGRGQEFRNRSHAGNLFDDEADRLIAAAGHFGYMSDSLVKGIAGSLGYLYLSASSKEEFEKSIGVFMDPNMNTSSMIFEIFTDTKDESNALDMVTHLADDSKTVVKEVIKSIIGENGYVSVKKMLGK